MLIVKCNGDTVDIGPPKSIREWVMYHDPINSLYWLEVPIDGRYEEIYRSSTLTECRAVYDEIINRHNNLGDEIFRIKDFLASIHLFP